MAVYFVLIYLLSLAFAYVLAFTNATLEIGRALSETSTPTGYQDAITPPRFGIFAITVYVMVLSGIVYGFWRYGWLAGLAATVSLPLMAIVNKVVIIPKSESGHFRNLILNSMISRHAAYLKAGDVLRATAMAHLLEKMDVPVNELRNRLERETGHHPSS